MKLSGLEILLVQKGLVGPRVWRADDGSQLGAPLFSSTIQTLGDGADLAVAISASQNVEPQARAYIGKTLPDTGTLISFTPPSGPGQQALAGGGHAAALAEQISNAVRDLKADDRDRRVHIFAACPNSLLFYLGQQHRGFSPCIVYEFDFDRKGDKTYQPSFLID